MTTRADVHRRGFLAAGAAAAAGAVIGGRRHAVTTVPLRETATVVLNGAGAGTAKIGPLSDRETWHPSNASVRASSHVLEATCELFVGAYASAGASRGTTFTGSTGDTTGAIAGDVVRSGEYVFAVWSGGDPAAVATLNVTGSKDV